MEYNLKNLTDKVLGGGQIDRDEAVFLYCQPLDELTRSADEIRRHFCRNRFDLCSIINAKSGRCSENCKFCAQSACHRTEVEEYSLLPEGDIVSQAARDAAQGSLRFSIVTSGRRLADDEIEKICSIVRRIRESVGIAVCASVGLLTVNQFRRLKEAGLSRAHNNLETSRRNFPNICTTHTFDDKVRAIRAAQAAGLQNLIHSHGGVVYIGGELIRIPSEKGITHICIN